MYRWLLLVVALLFGIAACSNGKTVVLPPVDGQEAVLKALANGTAGKSLLRGTVTVDGFTVPGPVGTPTSMDVMAKIINPIDDILSSSDGSSGSQFDLQVDGDAVGRFEVEFEVAEDVNGDGTTPDKVILAVPVDLPAGKLATFNMTVTRGVKASGPPTSGEPGNAEDVFYPALAGEVLLVDVTLSDANGPKSSFYAVTPGGSAAFDADGDRFIEAGDDTIYADANHNGWPDESEAAFKNADATALSAKATVNAVDRVKRELTLRDAAGTLTTIIVDPFASIVPVTAEGTLLGSLLLDQSLVGRELQVYGLQDGAENRAALAVVLPIDSKSSAQ
jgi:hypothetical protein